MKKLQLSLLALRVPVDFVALLLAAYTAYVLRYQSIYATVRPILTRLEYAAFAPLALKVSLLWLLIFACTGLYTSRRLWIRAEILKVILACSTGVVALIAVMFVQQELFSSRFVVLVAWCFAILYVSIGRLLIHFLERVLYLNGIGVTKIVMIGSGPSSAELEAGFKRQPALGFRVVKTFERFDSRVAKTVQEMMKRGGVDELWLADPDTTKKDALEILDFAEEHHILFKYSADLLETTTKHFSINTYAGIPVVEFKPTRLEGWGRIFKRIADIIFSLILIILSIPFVLFGTIAIMIQDGFPVFFQNIRVGSHGKTFKLYKLRTMWKKYSIGPQFKGAEANLKFEQELIKERSIKAGPVYKIVDDPRHTPIGKFLRRWSIDELPQFWNVLIGNMSLVGPRPHQPREVARYEPRHLKVHSIKPGITGLAQISGRSDLSFEDEVRLDIYYMENWSPWLDLYILVKTPFAIISKKGAY